MYMYNINMHIHIYRDTIYHVDTTNLVHSPKIFTSSMIYVDQFNWAVRPGTCI